MAPLICLIAVTSFTTGCLGTYNGFLRPVGPDYRRPKAPVADYWIDAEHQRVISEQADYRQWWLAFNDPILDSLIETAYQQNIPLREAGMRVLQARAQAGVARGSLFPQEQLTTGGYARHRISQNIFNSVQIPDPDYGIWRAGFDAFWELDFWGRYRRNIEAADAEVDASIEDYDDVLVILLAEVAGTYIELRTLDQRIAYARENVETQSGSLRLAEVRSKNGAVTELDVQQAKSNLGQTEAIVPRLEAARRQAQNRLCTLLGIPPQNLTTMLGGIRPIPAAPSEVVVGIPADLLRRRPDVRRAERQAAAQSARIGVAASDLYPHFFIHGTIGLEANQVGDLFDSRSWAGIQGLPFVNPGFRWDILNYGRFRNNVLAQEAMFEQLVARYQEAVLQANAEVEDSLVAFLKAQERTSSLQDSVEAYQQSVRLATIQYTDGAIAFDRVFTLQRFLSEQQDQLAESQGAIGTSLIGVYKALGGGWRIRIGPAGVQRLPAGPGAAAESAEESNAKSAIPPLEGAPPPAPGVNGPART